MIYSRSAEYAIRALVHLARTPDGNYAMVKTIAEAEAIPAHFLAKILQQLARQGMLRSSKGPAGGFALGRAARDIPLAAVVGAIDGLESYSQCIHGHPECTDSVPCAMHESWMPLRSRMMDYLERNSIADLSKALDRKQAALSGRRSSKPKRGAGDSKTG